MRPYFGKQRAEIIPARNLKIGDRILVRGHRTTVKMLTELPSGSMVVDVTINGRPEQTYLRPLQLVERHDG